MNLNFGQIRLTTKKPPCCSGKATRLINNGVVGSTPGYSSLSKDTLNRGPMAILQDKLLTRTYCYDTENYVVPDVLSSRDLVFRLDLSDKTGPSSSTDY